MSNEVIDFEVIGDTPEIEVQAKVEFIGTAKPVVFTACWQREAPAVAQQVLTDILEKEQDLEGAALINYQAEMIAERLVAVKGFPIAGGRKKIDAGLGESYEYGLDGLLDKVLELRPYHTGLYRSMFNSLAERDMFEAKRKN